MALICIGGLDRTGKSSVARWYETQGYKIVHLSAPDARYTQPGYVGPSYFEDYVEMLSSFNGQNIVMDRFWDGELVWPQIFNRKSLLSSEEIEVLREIEASQGVTYILMGDPNSEAHWQRCVSNNEPLTKAQFIRARTLYSSIADKYGFQRKSLKDFPMAEQPLPNPPPAQAPTPNQPAKSPVSASAKTSEQLKLERANVINEILSRRILKSKGPIYDELERSVRCFLNNELAKIFGNAPASPGSFNKEEVELLKFFCQRLKEKEG